MIAYVTSMNEPTTALCKKRLEKNGFQVFVLNENETLAEKLKRIYNANIKGSFLRVDADIIVNKHMTPELLDSLYNPDIWWWQFITFDWYKQDVSNSMAFISEEALPALRANIDKHLYSLRPETDMSRLKEFNNPRRFKTYTKQIMGIHGYGIKDIEPVKKLKKARGQYDQYDFELAKELNRL